MHLDGHAAELDAAPADDSPPAARPWPMLDPLALHGLVKDAVQAIDPRIEADPAAVRVSFLTGFGDVDAGREAGERGALLRSRGAHPDLGPLQEQPLPVELGRQEGSL